MTIQDVSRLSGLSIDVLRVWERRYGALQPRRLANNRRDYSRADLERAMLLRACVRSGRTISSLAALDDAGLSRLLTGMAPQNDEAMIAAMLAHVHENDGAGLLALLEQSADALAPHEFCDRIASPLLREVGEYWLVDEALIAKEHLTSAVLMRFLAGRTAVDPAHADRPLVFSTIPAERHMIGTAMAAFVAGRMGFPSYVTGGGATPEELAALVRHVGARGVGLSVVYSDADDAIREAAGNLPGVPLWVGGARAGEGPWTRVESMTQFAGILNAL